MKKILLILLSIFMMCWNMAEPAVLEASVSMSDQVPQEFFGDWRVVSVCTKSTDKSLLNTKGVDIWVLSRMGDIITLSNPLSGAVARVMVDDVKGQTVKFEKKGFFPNEQSVETPILTLQGDKFTGVDKISIKTFQNGKLIKEDYVEYQVRGTRISGSNISGIFGM